MQVYNNPLNSNDTICAVATQPGGAIGIIRVSGNDAIRIVDSIFSRRILDAPANSLHYGEILNERQETIDEVVVSIWRAPHSYTGENSVEISCHGSAYIMEEVLHRLIECNCRQAKPGEYTQRAYLNGKMDLSQTEAVADLIASTNKASYKLALSQLKGHFSSELSVLRQQLLKINSLLELELDFSDHEELEFADRTELITLAEEIDNKVVKLAHSFKVGQALKTGIPVAIIGKTNVGKSTLLNCLLHDNRAIVSDIHGTTRDIIEDTIAINGVDFHFIDTAGIRKTTDQVEQLGIERTYATLKKAQIVLWVVDKLPTNGEEEEIFTQCIDKHLILVHNKVDNLTETIIKEKHWGDFYYCEIEISGKYNLGIDRLEKLIYKVADLPEISENTTIVMNARHYDTLTRAHISLQRVKEALNMNLSGDLISEDLKETISILAEITGDQITSQETLHNIFRHFCIGK